MKFLSNKKLIIGISLVLALALLPVGVSASVGGLATGLGAGAVIGAGIGSLFGGIGAIPGAAIGAGVLGLAGLIKGNVLNALTSGAIYYAATAIAYMMSWIAAAIFFFGGWLVDFALRINYHLLDSILVQTGWRIVLAFTNLGFVLTIIVIAFATIFQFETYAMKQTLWKLIVAALIVNFSLVIAGAFIDVSHLFAKFLNERITGQNIEGSGIGGGISTKLADLMKVQALLSGSDFLGLLDKNSQSCPSGQVPYTYTTPEGSSGKGCAPPDQVTPEGTLKQ